MKKTGGGKSRDTLPLILMVQYKSVDKGEGLTNIEGWMLGMARVKKYICEFPDTSSCVRYKHFDCGRGSTKVVCCRLQRIFKYKRGMSKNQ